MMRKRVKSAGNIFMGFAIPMFEYCFIKFQTKVVERVRNWVEGEKYKDSVGLVVREMEMEMEIGVCMCIGDRIICRCFIFYGFGTTSVSNKQNEQKLLILKDSKRRLP